MRKFAYLSLRILSLIMFVGGIILCILFHHNEWVAQIDHMASDASLWRMLFYVALGVTINSIPIYGFSFIVEAACKYLEKKDLEE